MSDLSLVAVVREENPCTLDARAMLDELSATLALYSADGAQWRFCVEDVQRSRSAFAVARAVDGYAIGCGALRRRWATAGSSWRRAKRTAAPRLFIVGMATRRSSRSANTSAWRASAASGRCSRRPRATEAAARFSRSASPMLCTPCKNSIMSISSNAGSSSRKRCSALAEGSAGETAGDAGRTTLHDETSQPSPHDRKLRSAARAAEIGQAGSQGDAVRLRVAGARRRALFHGLRVGLARAGRSCFRRGFA